MVDEIYQYLLEYYHTQNQMDIYQQFKNNENNKKQFLNDFFKTDYFNNEENPFTQNEEP